MPFHSIIRKKFYPRKAYLFAGCFPQYNPQKVLPQKGIPLRGIIIRKFWLSADNPQKVNSCINNFVNLQKDTKIFLDVHLGPIRR
jgi:hypothetical protein